MSSPVTLIDFQGHFRYYKRFNCLYLKIQHTCCTKSITAVGRHMWTIICTAKVRRKDSYDAARDLLAIAKFLVCCPITEILWKTASLRKVWLKSGSRLLSYGQKRLLKRRTSAILNFKSVHIWC